jgi:hypothetical protein
MAGPQKAAPVKPGDSYLLVNDRDEDLEAYDHSGQFLWKLPCLARGQGADTDTIVASARAYVHALNKLLVKRARTAPQEIGAEMPAAISA